MGISDAEIIKYLTSWASGGIVWRAFFRCLPTSNVIHRTVPHMTLLVCWAGVDTHGTSSLYMAADSRISWKAPAHFDHARKVFAFSKWPDVLGYCGDVLFPAIALSQIVELADAGLLFSESFSPKQKFKAIVNKLNDLFRSYPTFHSGLNENSLSVIHGSQDPRNNKSFFCHTIRWTERKGWYGEEKLMPMVSGILFSLGSGADVFLQNFERYEVDPTKDTSRAVFHCFCDTLSSITDSSIGGAPQLVGVIRKPDTSAITFGVISKGKRTFLGAHIDNLRHFDTVPWRNENFEVCDGTTMLKIPTAQAQPDVMRSRL